ncbi:MAG: hypothetical protein JWN71_323 [Xanthobacteraceae bacterium]|jgi:hypothetical protein|nr:hypothetical protein [Xanthobacteraceae bacterium]
MIRNRSNAIVAGVVGLLLWSTAPAMADSIDGDWCQPKDGRRFSIRGPAIVTPGGAKMEGDYQRHFFTYVVPAGEPSAGATIHMTLRGEMRVDLRVGDAGEPEVWVRCSATTS